VGADAVGEGLEEATTAGEGVTCLGADIGVDIGAEATVASLPINDGCLPYSVDDGLSTWCHRSGY